jgi:hypothetical protein
MKNNLLSLLALAFLFSVIACSSPAEEFLGDGTDDTVSIEITSRSLEPESNEEDINILLVRKWKDESGTIFLDLKIDGSFEGEVNGGELVYGVWEIGEDQKTLNLKDKNSGEGKGGGFSAVYSVIEISFESMKVKDQEGKELTFRAS